MRGVRAFMLCLLTALALSGGTRMTASVAVAQPQGDIDSLAYGESYGMVPAPTAVAYAAAPVPGTALGPADTVLVGERWF
jgi:polysaccharide export outer membrane protein